MFTHRHATTQADSPLADSPLADAPLADAQLAERYRLPPLRIAVSGSHGLIGSALCPLLTSLGHDVRRLVRQRSPDDPQAIFLGGDDAAPSLLRGIDAVIHLAGEPIAARRWTADVKRRIRDSRVQPTRQLCQQWARSTDDPSQSRRSPRDRSDPQPSPDPANDPPRTLLCASAIGIYGDRDDEFLSETSADGSGFLAEVARQWEDACSPASEAGIRVVHLRFGIILSPRGGALAKLRTPARWGLAGPLGRGDQWWSWIAIDDCLGAIYHALATPTLQGPVNIVAPVPVTNREFVNTLGRVLSRPARLPAPAAGLRLVLGEMADALLLASARVVPDRLQQTGFEFRFPMLEPALRHLLARP